MLLDLASLLLLTASLASGVSIPRRDPDALYARQTTGDPPFQSIPTTAKPDNTFSNGGPPVGGIDSTNEVPPDVYGNRTIDLPFGRLYVRISDTTLVLFSSCYIYFLETRSTHFQSAIVFRSSISDLNEALLIVKLSSSMAT